jgi:hypothetical protein
MFHVKGEFYGRFFLLLVPQPPVLAVVVAVVIKVSGRRN